MNFPGEYIHKEVRFRYHGEDLSFLLSQALFSSFDIDSGTKLLLKALAANIDFSKIQSLYDMGCGVGPIGLSLKKRHPHLRIFLQDRDALAVSFARENARRNNIGDARNQGDVDISGGLAFQETGGEKFDLIVSNLPAKAGGPALKWFFKTAREHLTENGTVAVVIVTPLEEHILSAIQEAGGQLLLHERGGSHVVLHAAFPLEPLSSASVSKTTEETEIIPHDHLAPYIRGTFSFGSKPYSYKIHAVYDVDGFDTLSHDTALIISKGLVQGLSGDILIWGPGQGHIPVAAALRNNSAIRSITLAGRDLLELEISHHNLKLNKIETPVTIRHLPSPDCLNPAEYAGKFGTIITIHDPVPGVPMAKQWFDAAAGALEPEGTFLISGRSSHLGRFPSPPSPLFMKKSYKHKGSRLMVYHLR